MNISMITNKNQKFTELYNDAIQRFDRQEKVYAS